MSMNAIVRSSSWTRVGGHVSRRRSCRTGSRGPRHRRRRVLYPQAPCRPDLDRLRATVEHLAASTGPPASRGRARRAEWIRGELEALGVAGPVEEERRSARWRSRSACCRPRASLAGSARRQRRPLGLLAAAGDRRRRLRRAARRSAPAARTATTSTSSGEAGDPDAAETLVFVAHHDAAHGGLIFRPELTRWSPTRSRLVRAPDDLAADACGWWSPGPALAGLGALLGPPLRRPAASCAAPALRRSATSPRARSCRAPTTT
jgi:hypothetical protein